MKQIIHKTLSIAILAFFSHTAMATDVTSTFTTGATLTATQMTEIKDAVNSKQDIVTGAGVTAALESTATIQILSTSPGAILLTQTINAPAAGKVIAMFTGSLFIGDLTAATSYLVRLKLNSGTTANSTEDGNVIFLRDTNTSTGTKMLPAAATRVFNVASAQTFTVTLTGWLQIAPSSGGVFLDDSTLTLLYVPSTY